MRASRRRATTRCRSTRRSPTSSRSCRRSSTCTTSAWSTATSSPTTSSRSATRVKLIDLGGVRRVDDHDSAIYGTVGYQAPEVPHVGPVGRLRHLHDRAHAGRAERWSSAATRAPTSPRCPPVDQTPLFQQHDSLYRLLLKACAPDPADRFASADELRVQLLGVLREVVARDARARPSTRRHSLLFECPTVADDSLDWQDLPRPAHRRRRPADAVAAHRQHRRPRRSGWPPASGARGQPPRCCWPGRGPRSRPGSPSVVDDAVRDAARATTRGSGARVWMSGPRRARQQSDWPTAQGAFNAVYGQVPGELAPKLALALACETGGEHRRRRGPLRDLRPHRRQLHRAGRLRPGPDPRRPRRRRRARSRPSTWCRRPAGRSPQARRRRAGLLAESGGGLPSLAAALDSIECLTIDPVDRSRFRVEVLSAALDAGASRTAPTPTVSIGGRPAAEPALRDGLEAAYRDLAGYTPDREERVAPRRPGQRGPPLDAAMTRPRAERGRAARRCGRRGVAALCPSCASPVASGERFCEACGADLGAGRGRRRRGRPTAAVRTPERAATRPTVGAAACHECGGDGRRRRLLHAVRGAGGRARATTSPSSRRPGWRPCATAASGTAATRTPSRSPPGPSRAATPCWWSATGSRPRPTPTSPAWPRPAPRATCWPASGPRRAGHAPPPGWRRAPRRSVAAADAANDAVHRRHRGRARQPGLVHLRRRRVDGAVLVVGWVGDSRAYWLPDDGRRRGC